MTFFRIAGLMGLWSYFELQITGKKSMEQWKLLLTSNGEDIGEVDVKRKIFQGDSLLPLLFVLTIALLSLILRTR